MPRDLMADALPHFMANGDKLQYHSTKILGRMHDATMAVADEAAATTAAAAASGPASPSASLLDADLLVPGHEAYLDVAIRARDAYARDIVTLMNRFGVFCEFELVGACPSRFGARAYRGKRRAAAAREALASEMRALRHRWAGDLEEELLIGENDEGGDKDATDTGEGGDKDATDTGESGDAAALEAAKLASAMYVVAYAPDLQRARHAGEGEVEEARGHGGKAPPPPPQLWSFPWLAAGVLARVKAARTR